MKRTILMLEHDDDDRYITQAVFDENQYNVRIEFVSNTQDLIKTLQFASTNTILPSLILLDYHAMPLGATEILRDLKSHPAYSHIPVIVLSGTSRKEIVGECYSAGASSFIQKPTLSAETSTKISNFIKYWFETAELV
jgi:two-component system, response regulator